MNKELAEQLLDLVKNNLDSDIPNVGVVKALLEDACSYLKHPIVSEESTTGLFTFDVKKCAPLQVNCINKMCYCDGSCKNHTGL